MPWAEITKRLRDADAAKIAEIYALANRLVSYDYGPGRDEERARLLALEEEVGLVYEPMNDRWRLPRERKDRHTEGRRATPDR